jgi:hypothetical protein
MPDIIGRLSTDYRAVASCFVATRLQRVVAFELLI